MNAEAFPLHEAAERGCEKDVNDILKNSNVVVDAKDSDGFTPFALACRGRHVGVMRLLLEAKADPQQEFKFPEIGSTAAFAACDFGNAEMLRLMFKFGVSVNERFRGTPLLLRAVRAKAEGAKNVVALLLRRMAITDDVDARETAALYWACRREDIDLDVVRLLLVEGANVDTADLKRRTPLYLVCSARTVRLDLVQLLLDFKANVNQVCEWEGEQKTPLMAALHGDREVEQKMALAKLLVSRGADVNVKLQMSWSPLTVAIDSGCAEATRWLLQLGADPNAFKNGYSPLLRACKRGDHWIAEMLLDAGADVNAFSQVWVRTPLFEAVMWPGCERVVDLMLARGADLGFKDPSGWTILHQAVFWGSPSTVRFFLRKGVDPNVLLDDGKTVLHLMCQGQELHRGDTSGKAAVLLEHGADAEVTDDEGLTPFLQAVVGGDDEMLDLHFDRKLDCLPDGYEDEE